MKPVTVLAVLTLASLVLGGAQLAWAADLAPAQAMIEKKAFAEAIPLLEEIVAVEPANSEAWCLLGDALSSRVNEVGLIQKMSVAKRGLAAYNRAVAADPRSISAHRALVQFHLQAPSFVGGRRSEAYGHANALAGLDAWQGNFWLIRLALDDDKPAEAFAACDRLLALEPERYRVLYQLGRTAAVAGDQLQRGADALRKALALEPGKDDPSLAHANLRLGQILEKQGDRTGAIAAYSTALRLDEKLTDAKTRLAKLR